MFLQEFEYKFRLSPTAAGGQAVWDLDDVVVIIKGIPGGQTVDAAPAGSCMSVSIAGRCMHVWVPTSVLQHDTAMPCHLLANFLVSVRNMVASRGVGHAAT